MKYYATFNIYANVMEGNSGFMNTWQIVRFTNKKDRDIFVEKENNRSARVITRKEAEKIFASTYLCVGQEVPKGGLFGKESDGSYFYEPFNC